MPAEIFYN